MKKESIMKILKETEEKWVRLDVNMDKKVEDLLEQYAYTHITAKELAQLVINWSFNDIIKNQLRKAKNETKTFVRG